MVLQNTRGIARELDSERSNSHEARGSAQKGPFVKRSKLRGIYPKKRIKDEDLNIMINLFLYILTPVAVLLAVVVYLEFFRKDRD
ncbi:MAG: hypothetical protein HY891_08505 [Deltaproteobacteria bacterium]|nr:hypothetical protein [Deltaproteobacteria bacterium]